MSTEQTWKRNPPHVSMDSEQDLQCLIRQRFGSTHNFCKSTGFPRATAYQVLSGRYAGNIERQKQRISEQLTTKMQGAAPLTVLQIEEVIQSCKCETCRPVRRRKCAACRAQARHEAQVLWECIVSKYS